MEKVGIATRRHTSHGSWCPGVRHLRTLVASSVRSPRWGCLRLDDARRRRRWRGGRAPNVQGAWPPFRGRARRLDDLVAHDAPLCRDRSASPEGLAERGRQLAEVGQLERGDGDSKHVLARAPRRLLAKPCQLPVLGTEHGCCGAGGALQAEGNAPYPGSTRPAALGSPAPHGESWFCSSGGMEYGRAVRWCRCPPTCRASAPGRF